MSNDPFKLVEFCIIRGLHSLSETFQYYVPASQAKGQDYLNAPAEANITVNLARSFSESQFLNWSEVPFADSDRRLDFLAFNYSKEILVYLEFKNSLWQTENNIADFWKLVDLYNNGISNAPDFIYDAKHKFYGIVSILDAVEFADWWMNPVDEKGNALVPENKNSEKYKQIALALDKANQRYTVPIKDWYAIDENKAKRFRILRAVYALYDAQAIQELAKVRCDFNS